MQSKSSAILHCVIDKSYDDLIEARIKVEKELKGYEKLKKEKMRL